MGDVIDFAEKQKGRRKKKAFSIPPILRKFRVHAIRLLVIPPFLTGQISRIR